MTKKLEETQETWKVGPTATTKQSATFEQHVVDLHAVMQLETLLGEKTPSSDTLEMWQHGHMDQLIPCLR